VSSFLPFPSVLKLWVHRDAGAVQPREAPLDLAGVALQTFATGLLCLLFSLLFWIVERGKLRFVVVETC